MAEKSSSFSLVQFGVGADGALKLVMVEEVWNQVSAAIKAGDFLVKEGAVHINLAKIAGLDAVRSINVVATTQEPPCPPIGGGGGA